MAGQWKTTANRGFYYGPSSNNAWNNDVGWKHAIARENRLASKFVEAQLLSDEAGDAKQEAASSKGGSVVTSSSRDSLYRHFDKLTKEEQVAVLKDALGRKDRLDKLESSSERFDDATLQGLSSQAKAEKLIKALGNERSSRLKKEQMFVELLNEERAARLQAETAMKQLENKLDTLASVMGVPAKQNYLKRTSKKV
mmetsp:Transcript_60276/g.123840  ORF Transcript_60276/g.123840 Transcript_60276/m.123840 type:complete len:197 (-) Transcript_60276:398-988(-)|eukprot:CAMPEP_0181342536 /NCGR_PEP_ID=MMETSP1101-20121128/31057_1 /TAXON_ID=46948 /ORGANISM="Rhodomonas abbreviata, Strain Caron Lab Isolate" /LENGTH=196 /DNA_ID=CAMNT_0023454009 /DNA_START=247 /DNA_END=837 /DNA_ORIENTATION=-